MRRPGRKLLSRLAAIGMVLTVGLATACSDGDLEPELVAGTERIEPGDDLPWFTISPEERWLAFMEVDSIDWDPEGLLDHLQAIHLVTMDLESGFKTHHDISGVPARLFSGVLEPWRDVQMWWHSERSWSGDRLYIELKRTTLQAQWIAFTPQARESEIVPPPGVLTCCACAPHRSYVGVLKNRGIEGYNQGTAAYKDGKFSRVIYASPLGSDWKKGAIDRVKEDGSVERVFEDRRTFRSVVVEELLVSPNERYLAFTLTTYVRSPIPLPTIRQELRVLDLETGNSHRAPGTYRILGNLMWSEDSRRLYFAAVDGYVADRQGDGIYQVILPH